MELLDTKLIGQIFDEGGIFIWFILLISILAVTISIERYLALRFRYGIDGRRLFNEVKKYIAANDWHRAGETCRQYSLVPLAQVLEAGISHANQPIEDVENAMESQTLYYIPRINERIPYLASLANIATLMGLLGTIAGLISSFSGLSHAAQEGLSKGEAIAGGIAIAMYCTAFGLIVAIPTLMAHMFLANKATRLVDDIDHYASALKQLIVKTKTRPTSTGLPDMKVA